MYKRPMCSNLGALDSRNGGVSEEDLFMRYLAKVSGGVIVDVVNIAD
jgi:hypothetical protein